MEETSVQSVSWLQRRNRASHRRYNLHCSTTSTVPDSTTSANRIADRSDPTLRGIVTGRVWRDAAAVLFGFLGRRGSVLPRFLPSIQWLRMNLRSSGSGFSTSVETTNCSTGGLEAVMTRGGFCGTSTEPKASERCRLCRLGLPRYGIHWFRILRTAGSRYECLCHKSARRRYRS